MRWPWLLFALLPLSGCDSCGGGAGGREPASRDEPPASEGPASPSSTVVLEGVVRLAEGAELPSYPENPMVAPPGRPDLPEGCTPPQQRDRQPVQRASDGGLSGVLVALHDFSTIPDHEPVTHEMTITDCRLTPSLVVATRGDRLRLTNETDYPFLPDFGGGMMRGLLHQQSREVELDQGGVRTLRCGFAASCGRAEIVTLYHPLHAITDEHGSFRIEGVPAGEEVRVSAWHPLFEEASRTMTLRPGRNDPVELTLTPAEITAPPPPPEHEGPAENDPNVFF